MCGMFISYNDIRCSSIIYIVFSSVSDERVEEKKIFRNNRIADDAFYVCISYVQSQNSPYLSS